MTWQAECETNNWVIITRQVADTHNDDDDNNYNYNNNNDNDNANDNDNDNDKIKKLKEHLS